MAQTVTCLRLTALAPERLIYPWYNIPAPSWVWGSVSTSACEWKSGSMWGCELPVQDYKNSGHLTLSALHILKEMPYAEIWTMIFPNLKWKKWNLVKSWCSLVIIIMYRDQAKQTLGHYLLIYCYYLLWCCYFILLSPFVLIHNIILE